MAIFSKSNQQANHAGNITTIAAGARVTGKIDIECVLHIDGEFDGDITSSSVIKIGKTGVLKSNLKAQKLIVTGRYTGTAECEIIEIISGAQAKGTLIASSLVVDAESCFQGESILREEDKKETTVVDFVAENTQREPKLGQVTE